MKAYLEPFAFQLRLFADADMIGNPPWVPSAGATVTMDDFHIATVRSLIVRGALDPFEARSEMLAALARVNAVGAVWTRLHDGRVFAYRCGVPGSGLPLYL